MKHSNGHANGNKSSNGAHFGGFDLDAFPGGEWDRDYGPGADFNGGTSHAKQQPNDEPAVPLSVIDPREWQGKPIPPREWDLPDLIPKRTVTTISGDGAGGKSTLILQLVVTRCIQALMLGVEPSRGRTLYLSAEDDAAELQRRVGAICRHYRCNFSDLADLILVDLVGQDAVLGALSRQTGKIEPTPLYKAIARLIRETLPDMIVIDALADAFAGIENDRQQARQFIGILLRLCREFGVTVILIAHPSLSGMTSGSGMSGSTAWNNSVRSRLYLESDKGTDGIPADPDMRTLTTKKANYTKMGGQIRMRYVDGAFVVEQTNVPANYADRAAFARRVFIDLLCQFNATGQTVSQKTGRNYAPSMFASAPDSQGLKKADFATAMKILLRDRRIKIEEYGPPSKRYSRLDLVKNTQQTAPSDAPSDALPSLPTPLPSTTPIPPGVTEATPTAGSGAGMATATPYFGGNLPATWHRPTR